MSNSKSVRNKGEEIEINDKKYILKFTLNSFIELEDLYGSIDAAMENLQGIVVKDENGNPIMEEIEKEDGTTEQVEKRQVKFKSIRDILFAGLIAEQPDIKKEDVGNFDFRDLKEIVQKLMRALTSSLPKQEVDEKN